MPGNQTKRKKLVIVSEYFFPNSTGSSKVLTELAEDLSSYGMDIEVITSRHIYNEGQGKLPKYDEYNSIGIYRVWSLNLDKNSNIKRLVNNFSYLISVLFKLLFQKRNHHVLYVSNPPIVALAGNLLNLIKGQKYSYLIHDLYPDIAVAMGVVSKESMFVKIFNIINKLIFKRTTKIIVLGKDMKQKILDKGIDEGKIEIITNWADKSKIRATPKENRFSKRENLHNKFVILYTGNMGKFHQLEILIETAKSLTEYKDIVFVFVGEGYKKSLLQSMVKGSNITNVYFYPYQPDDLYGDVLATGDLLVTSLEKGVEGTAVPSKTYSYMAAGKPLLGLMSNNSEIGSLINEENLGFNQENYENPQQLVQFIKEVFQNRELLKEYEKNVIATFEKNYERQKVTKKFYSLFINTN